MVTPVLDGGRYTASTFDAYAAEQIPAYARPVFVRIAKSLKTTVTFKYRKIDLVTDGFDPEKVDGAIYVRGGKAGYQKLTPAVYQEIVSGDFRL